MEKFLNKLKNKESLNFEESKSAFESMMSGKVKEEDIYDFLTLSSAKGETSDEIAGGVYVLRDKAERVNVSDDAVDTCGTGGDMSNTLNISTSASIVAASAGAIIAKHGNRSVSSRSGSADMLEKLGYKISSNVEELEKPLDATTNLVDINKNGNNYANEKAKDEGWSIERNSQFNELKKRYGIKRYKIQ